MKLRWRCWPIDSSPRSAGRGSNYGDSESSNGKPHMTIASLIRALFGGFDRNRLTSLLKGTFAAPATLRDDAAGARFRIRAAMALLVLYAVMHLTIGGILQLLNPAD